MYRKLMFLISLVVLLGLTGSLFAAPDWTGGGTDNLWWTSENWNPVGVPGPTATATIKPVDAPAWNDPVIDRDTTIGTLEGPCWDSDGTQTLSITGGNINIGAYGRDEDGEGQAIINISGSPVIVVGSQMRCTDSGNTTVNISGTPTVSIDGDLRGGDSDGTVFNVNMSGGIVAVAGVLNIGDDGSGVFNLSGGSFTAERVQMSAKVPGETATFNLSGTGQVTCTEVLQIGKDCDDEIGFATMNMSGGNAYAAEGVTVGGNNSDGFCGKASLNMTGGSIVSDGPLDVGAADDVNLVAGTIEASSMVVADTGLINIKGLKSVAKIILPGNQLGPVSTLVTAGKLKGNGSSRLVAKDYNVTTPGKTTVWYDPTIDLYKAYDPDPADGEINVRCVTTPITLKWVRGDGTFNQTKDYVYLGTDKAAVDAANMSSPEFVPPPVLYLQLPQKFIGNKPLWTTYYWRVDEQLMVGGVSTLKHGDVWSFTTGCESITGDTNRDCLLNFLDYANLAEVWQQSQYWP